MELHGVCIIVSCFLSPWRLNEGSAQQVSIVVFFDKPFPAENTRTERQCKKQHTISPADYNDKGSMGYPRAEGSKPVRAPQQQYCCALTVRSKPQAVRQRRWAWWVRPSTLCVHWSDKLRRPVKKWQKNNENEEAGFIEKVLEALPTGIFAFSSLVGARQTCLASCFTVCPTNQTRRGPPLGTLCSFFFGFGSQQCAVMISTHAFNMSMITSCERKYHEQVKGTVSENTAVPQ